MSDQRGSKLNQLQQHVPEGMLVDVAWLNQHGYRSNLRERYVGSGWLERVTPQVYRRPLPRLRPDTATDIPWSIVVASLQTIMGWTGVVGGRTALELQGYRHYLRADGPQQVHLHGEQHPPNWLLRLPTSTRFVFHRAGRLFGDQKQVAMVEAVAVDTASGTTTPIPKGVKGGPPFSPWSATNWPVTCSSIERATLEMLDELPDRESFHQVDMLFQSLSNLSPRRLQRLLEACSKVKVKRLFFWFAVRHNHRWLKQLERSRVDLGTGKRMIAKEGRLDREFQITVPKDLDASA